MRDKPGLLRSAFKHLFSARKADWEKFDGLFDAFWLGKRVRSRSAVVGLRRAAEQSVGQEPAGQPAARPADRRARPDSRRRRARRRTIAAAKAAWKAPRGPKTSPRRISARSPIRQQMRGGACHRRAAGQGHAHQADPPRPRPPARLPARPAPHHPPQHQPWRRADQPGEAAAQGKAAAAGDAARRVGLDEHVHRRLPALHPRRAGRVPRGRGVPVPHAAGPCLRRDEGARRAARARPAVDDGARRRRRHQDRRVPRRPSTAGMRRASSIRAPA